MEESLSFSIVDMEMCVKQGDACHMVSIRKSQNYNSFDKISDVFAMWPAALFFVFSIAVHISNAANKAQIFGNFTFLFI